MFETALIAMLACVVWAISRVTEVLKEIRDAINNHKGGPIL